ncbi:hypothetical protein A2872_03465 [Candidatus Gottesmanbacteria bacterium RIFCSPHIGHO2_01_FULL_42_12]|uniref:EamA domain-containing protein n=1 Tax=Candidatus Gottesmanbacteria bacterium RIFCSPHIGHO2_01_FULL_42_12 TaxID=1798377 RepID=A0A1F5Z4K2_9BACT|nr:MAG: hypothetical protein A2872_03465 [Candidatus Gottesmanbacteria bacterium RIFCSPHIGHO2_01_FULL_42_12]
MAGLTFAFAAAIISGFSIYVNKFAVGSVASPVLFTTLKNFLVGILLFGLLIFSKKIFQIKKLSRVNLIKLSMIGLIGGSIPFYLFFTGLSQVPAINGAIIQKTLVIWVTLLAIPFLKEKLTLTNILAVGLLFYANIFIGGFKGFKFSPGELMILAATILWSVENIIAKKTLTDVDPDVVAFFRMGFGSLILIGVIIATQPASLWQLTKINLNQGLWIAATTVSLFGYVLTFFRALKQAPAITVTSILVLSTLITNLLSTKTGLLPQAGLMAVGVLLLLKPLWSSTLISKFHQGLKA